MTGFTLVELMIGVTILGIMAAFAAPTFKELMDSQRVKGASFEMTAALTLARSEAIKQNGAVTLTPVGGTTAWANGWSTTGPDGVVIGTQGAYTGITITGPTSIVYNRSGRATAAVTITIESTNPGSTLSRRCISVGLTGQPKSATC
jgi:type IV fimbrial biogenesis protein FimT